MDIFKINLILLVKLGNYKYSYLENFRKLNLSNFDLILKITLVL